MGRQLHTIHYLETGSIDTSANDIDGPVTRGRVCEKVRDYEGIPQRREGAKKNII